MIVDSLLRAATTCDRCAGHASRTYEGRVSRQTWHLAITLAALPARLQTRCLAN